MASESFAGRSHTASAFSHDLHPFRPFGPACEIETRALSIIYNYVAIASLVDKITSLISSADQHFSAFSGLFKGIKTSDSCRYRRKGGRARVVTQSWAENPDAR